MKGRWLGVHTGRSERARQAVVWLLLAWLGVGFGQGTVWSEPLPPAHGSTSLAVAPLVEQPEGRDRLLREVVALFAAHYWDPDHLDWARWGERYRSAARAAEGRLSFDAVMVRMVRELGDGHSSYLGLRSTGGANPAAAAGGEPAWSARIVADGVGVLTLRNFQAEGVAEGVHAALRSLQVQGAEALLVDLRGNGGGRLLEAGLVAGIFLEGVWTQAWGPAGPLWEARVRRVPALEGGGERLLAALGTDGGSELGHAELAQPARFSGPLVVLIDRFTASAGELLAHALRELAGARLVGEASAGNVEAVRPFRLSDGSQVLIAIAEMRSARGVSVGEGLQPAVVVGSSAAADLGLRAGLRVLRQLPFTPGRWFPPTGGD